MRAGRNSLSKREEAVLYFARAGLTDKEVARRLEISLETVRTYWQRIKTKLEIPTRAEAIAIAASDEAATMLKCKESENEALIDEITRRKLAEQLMSESESRFRAICESSIDGILITDARGTCHYANPACGAIGYVDPDGVAGKPWWGVARQRLPIQQLRKVLVSLARNHSFSGEVSFQSPGGDPRFLHLQVSPVNRDGRVVGYCSILKDVTANHNLATELDEARRIGESISAATRDLVYIHDLISKTTIYANSVGERIMGFTHAQIREMGASATGIFIHPDDIPEMDKLSARYASQPDGVAVEFTFRVKRPDATYVKFHGRSVILKRDPDGTPRLVLGVARPEVCPDCFRPLVVGCTCQAGQALVGQ